MLENFATTIPPSRRKFNPAFQAAARMPPLRHFRKGEPFDIMRSEAVDFLISLPELRQEVWNWAKRNQIITLDLEQQKWVGVNYRNEQ